MQVVYSISSQMNIYYDNAYWCFTPRTTSALAFKAYKVKILVFKDEIKERNRWQRNSLVIVIVQLLLWMEMDKYIFKLLIGYKWES